MINYYKFSGFKKSGSANFRPVRWSFQDFSYGLEENQKFDLLLPEEKASHAIVYIHGGAYLVGNKLEYPSFLSDFSGNNVIASIDYRLINENSSTCMNDILSDINLALLKIKEIAIANGIIIKDFVLIGHSAGGHIALLYAYRCHSKDIKISSCVSLAGPTDFSDDLGWSSMSMWGDDMETRLSFLSYMGSRLTGHSIELAQTNWTKQANYKEFEKYILEISPITYISKAKNIPPTLMIHGRADNQVPYSNAVRLKNALNLASIPHKLITTHFSANDHMLGGNIYSLINPILFGNQKWVIEAKNWISRYL